MRYGPVGVLAGLLWACGGADDDGDDEPEGNVCTRGLHHQQECWGDPPQGAYADDECVGVTACSFGCSVDASCDVLLYGSERDPAGFQVLYDCQYACAYGGTTPYSEPYTDPTGNTTAGTDTGTAYSGGDDDDDSTGGTGPRAECVAFANVYCGCLGNYASDTCEEDMAENCDWVYDYAPEFYDCVTAAQCQGDWVTECSP